MTGLYIAIFLTGAVVGVAITSTMWALVAYKPTFEIIELRRKLMVSETEAQLLTKIIFDHGNDLDKLLERIKELHHA